MSMYRIFAFADALKISEKQIDTLEKQLEASEEARRDAEVKAMKVEELEAKLDAAEKARDDAKAKAASFEERIAHIDDRETSLMSRIKKLSAKFCGKSNNRRYLAVRYACCILLLTCFIAYGQRRN